MISACAIAHTKQDYSVITRWLTRYGFDYIALPMAMGKMKFFVPDLTPRDKYGNIWYVFPEVITWDADGNVHVYPAVLKKVRPPKLLEKCTTFEFAESAEFEEFVNEERELLAA